MRQTLLNNTVDDVVRYIMSTIAELLKDQICYFSRNYDENKYDRYMNIPDYTYRYQNKKEPRYTTFHTYKRRKRRHICFDEDGTHLWDNMLKMYPLIYDDYMVDEFASKYGISMNELEYNLYYHKLLEAKTKVYVDIIHHDFIYQIHKHIKVRNRNKKISMKYC
jgi:hypothetical protein